MYNEEKIEEQKSELETQSPILMTLFSTMSYEDAKIMSTYKKWRIIDDL